MPGVAGRCREPTGHGNAICRCLVAAGPCIHEVQPVSTTPHPGPRKLTVPQLSRQWGVSQNKILQFVKRGELRAMNLASHGSTRPRYAIDIDDIAAFERARQVVVDGGEVAAPRRRRRTENVKDYF